MESYDDYLQHWGILGMKWGQRNGPPYPLSKSQMNSAERKEAIDNKAYAKQKSIENAALKKKLAIANKQAEADAKLKIQEDKMKLLELKNKQTALKNEEKHNKIKGMSEEKKNPRSLDNDQLKDAISRRENEKKLDSLNQSSVANGKSFVKSVIKLGVTTAAVTGVVAYSKKMGNRWAENRFYKKSGDAKRDAAKKAAETAKAAANAASEAKRDALRQEVFDKAWKSAWTITSQTGKPISDIADANARFKAVKEFINFKMQSAGFDPWYNNK